MEIWPTAEKPIIGMLHAQALPGSPGFGGDMESVRSAVLRDSEALTKGGVDGLILENFGDSPFLPQHVPAFTATHLTALAIELRSGFDLPLGINVLRNDGRTALAIADAVGAQFIRVNVLAGARVTDQGLIEGIAHDLMRDRALLGAGKIKVFADVNVKHSTPLGSARLNDQVGDLVERAGADGLIVTGPATGKPPDMEELESVKAEAGDCPVFVGSGVSAESVEDYCRLADGFIVGSYFKIDGETTNPVDPARVRGLMEKVR